MNIYQKKTNKKNPKTNKPSNKLTEDAKTTKTNKQSNRQTQKHRHILVGMFGFRVALVAQINNFVSQKEVGDKGSPGDLLKDLLFDFTWEIY